MSRPDTLPGPSDAVGHGTGGIGRLADLAALEAARTEKEAILDRAAALGTEEVGALPAGLTAADVPALVHRYYRGEPAAEVVDHQPDELVGLALDHLRLAAVRPQGSATVDLQPPADGAPGVLRVVTDDMPFLVDSVAAEVVRQGVGLEHVVHPVVVVRRDVTGRLLEFCDSGNPESCGADALAESWMAVVLVGPVDEEAAEDLLAGLRTVLADVRGVHEDAARLTDRALDLAHFLDQEDWDAADPVDAAAGDPHEAAALLRWMTEGNFVFLGARDVDLVTDAEGNPATAAVPGSGLGVLRADTDMSSPVVPIGTAARDVVGRRVVVTKADVRSTVHRPAWLDVVAVTLPGPQGTRGRQHRLVGLFPTGAYTASVTEVPVLRRTAAAVLARSGVAADSHTGKELLDVLETYPRDELLQVDVDELLPVALAVLHLRERRQTRLFLRRDPLGRFFSALVYLPRDRYTTEVRLAMQQLLLEHLGGSSVEYTARSTESVLARLHFVVRVPIGKRGASSLPAVDAAELERRLAAVARSWTDDLADVLTAEYGADAERRLAQVADAFPAAYQEDFPASTAVADLDQLESLAEGELALRLWTPRDAAPGERRLTVFRVGKRLLLTDVLPVLQHLGVDVVDERPYEIDRIGAPLAWVYDFGLALPAGHSGGLPAMDSLPRRFTDAISAVWRSDAESDGLGALVLVAGLTWQQVAVVRAYVQWLRQGGLPFGARYVESALAAHPDVVAGVVELFAVRFDPDQTGDRAGAERALVQRLTERISAVESLDADRVLSALLGAVLATQRTTAYAPGAFTGGAPLAIKLDPQAVTDLPEPRPAREVWVSSPRVIGVHLRFGAVARGGLRWSDRREDLRTEVLGLVKAQTVKNTVIVPTGAKGGFVVLRGPGEGASREEVLAEGQACYRLFIGSLLALTDNLVEGAVVPPERVVRHDGDDTYLVVAADKGTATFSDLANAVAIERGFWLGDAFASGGSVGYDHKAMGITARGAWESVTRHFRELGVDTQSQEVTVVGIGDMSGDVFGNGMLLSEHLRLVAAFDHRHVFIDPTPDAARSFAERQRLFALPRSSWADYDRDLISAGGGVWPRTAKSVPVSEPMREALGLADEVDALTPAELVRAVLLAPVDLLFNGGIGTYVKAGTESHLDVGDKANDAVRVDGRELRVRVVGEGGNLGLTQRGRIEYALTGGRVNTDAIDNSAGVDTSDHEVNIKIALNRVVDDGGLDAEGRAELLASMTDEVAASVLTDNYAQNATLAAESASARSLLDAHTRFIRALERSGRLDRAVEALPGGRALAERRRDGHALTSPELSVLLAYAKLEVDDAVLHSTLPDDPALGRLLTDYVPAELRRRFPDAVAAHPLRREIIATALTNRSVNVAGVTGLFRLAEETGAPLVAVVRAHTVARAVFDVDRMWDAARPLDNRVPAGTQVQLRVEVTRLAERAARWLLRVPELAAEPAGSVAGVTARFAGPVAAVARELPEWLLGADAGAYADRAAALRSAGVPPELAADAALAPLLPAALDLAVVAEDTGAPIGLVGRVWQCLADRLGLVPLLELITALPRDRRWPAMARASLRDDLAAGQAELAAEVLRTRDADTAAAEELVARWAQRWDTAQRRAAAQLAELAGGEAHELAELVVAVRTLRGLRRS